MPWCLEDGAVDGFWANAMGAENAVRSGVGKVAIDVRRGLGPRVAFNYTISALVTSDRAIAADPEMVAAGLAAVIDAQQAIKADVTLARKVGEKLFPPAEAALITDVVARDLPFYTPEISREAVAGLNRFAQCCGLLTGSPAYESIVETQFSKQWNASGVSE